MNKLLAAFSKIKITITAYWVFLISIFHKTYSFTLKDVRLFLYEKGWQLKKVDTSIEKDGLIECNIENIRFHWPIEFDKHELPWIYNEIFYYFEKNPSSFNHPIIKFNCLDWVIDAGAHEGFFSILVTEHRIKKIITIEPVQELCHALKHTFQNDTNVFVENAALGNSETEIDLYLNCDHLCSASTTTKDGQVRKVNQTTIDNLVEKYNLTGTGLIKADIEGAEMMALNGAARTLQNLKPYLAIAVYHDYDNAKRCSEIITSFNDSYSILKRGMYAYYLPPRPYMLFAV